MLTLDTEKELSQDLQSVGTSEQGEIALHLSEMYALFSELSITELENALLVTADRSEKIFYRTLLNLKLQIDQEKIINQTLL
jgi:hypothetical protein